MAIQPVINELCNGCGICVKICSMDVFRLDRQAKKAIVRYPEDCMLCNFCVMECPNKAIIVTPDKSSRLVLSWG